MRHRKIADWTRLAMVRAPAARVVSCYRNRVLAQKALEIGGAEARVAAAGLNPKPDLAEFVAHFPAYQKASPSVLFHTRPLSHALGDTPDYFTRIYRFSEITDLAEEIGRLTGTALPLPHLQRRGREMSVDDLSPESLARIDEIFAEDHALFGRWF